MTNPVDLILLGQEGRAFGDPIVAVDGTVVVVGSPADSVWISTCFANDGAAILSARP
jgi:hypothetical protein